MTRLFPFIFFFCYDLIFTLFIFSEKEKHQLINHLRVIPLCLWDKLLFYMFFLLFLAFGFRFSSKILMGFSDLVSDVVFGFFYLDSGSSSIWAAIFRFHGSISHSRETHFASLVTSVSDLKGFWQPECENLSVFRAVFGVDRYFFGFFCFVFFFSAFCCFAILEYFLLRFCDF